MYGQELKLWVREQFANNILFHEVLESSLISPPHRSIVCRATDRSAYWFRVVTWPGGLLFTGDQGHWAWSLLGDGLVNFPEFDDRAAQKCVAGTTKEFNREKARDWLDRVVQEQSDRWTVKSLAELRIVSCSSKDVWLNDCVLSGVRNVSEADVDEYVPQFLWACLAIRWLRDRLGLEAAA